jgi:hypothetical protein
MAFMANNLEKWLLWHFMAFMAKKPPCPSVFTFRGEMFS